MAAGSTTDAENDELTDPVEVDAPIPAVESRPEAEIEEALGYTFRERALFLQAMTHPSYAHEHAEIERDNQRMEFLGDAVLGLVVAQRLFQRYPDLPEGRLSRIKAALVCEDTLASLAEELGLGAHLRLGRGERATGGDTKSSILADATEALFAAVYRDGGYPAAEHVVSHLFAERFEEARRGELVFDSKTVLQEHVQAGGPGRPHYVVEAVTGPPHKRVFTVSVSLGDERLAEGQGNSKKAAEKRAAAAALRALKRRTPPAGEATQLDTGAGGPDDEHGSSAASARQPSLGDHE